MYKILISGYYGFNNIGDESILRTVVDNLREKMTDIDITILSHDPKDTESKYGVKAVDRMSLRGIIKAVRDCDMLISGGGSLLQDVTSKKSILYYLFIMRLALMFGKKVFIYSQGIGPIDRPRNRRLTARVLKKVHGIVVRDENSAA
ncbi:MAG: polysaccharide pyruvyl transferase family protein, partial [Oscillospiraceae bacterium]|nr:polysaccharide pyruvyl transferase family protein [Oscillospiraceae bacterium]